MTTVIDHPRRGYRTIRLALAEADYARFMRDGEFARAQPAILILAMTH